MVHPPVRDELQRFLTVTARLALAVMTLLVARAIAAAASAMTLLLAL
jgi:hypothetical protein